jgi:hypothetical protein
MTDTPLGLIDVTAICIPWSRAHVSGGRRDRRPWEDHLKFIEGVTPLLKAEPSRPRILLGDFNQRIPRGSQPMRAFEALHGMLEPWFELATAGVKDRQGRAAIDHLAHTRDLAVTVSCRTSIARVPKAFTCPTTSLGARHSESAARASRPPSVKRATGPASSSALKTSAWRGTQRYGGGAPKSN